MKSLIIYFLFFIFLSACSDVAKTLRNEKTKTTDEFLVKKRDPLSMPPDYDKLPVPGSIEQQKKQDKVSDNIEQIFKIEKEKDTSNSSESSTEKTILDQIKK